jgi:sugar phosphate isomerase/epimerase
MPNHSSDRTPIGIGTTFDYSLPFEPMCRMIADAGFQAITIGGGNIAHSGYDSECGRSAMLDAVSRNGLQIDSLHAPFDQEADLSAIDVRSSVPRPDAQDETRAEQSGEIAPAGEPSIETAPSATSGCETAPRYAWKPDERRLQAIVRVKAAIDAAAALGAGIVIVHPADRFAADETRARTSAAKDSFRELVRYAAERDIRLAAENLASPLSNQVLEVLLEQLPELGICYDSSHAQLSGDAFGIVGRHHDRIIAVHLSDNLGLKDDHMLPFEGVVRWDEFAYYLPRLNNLKCLMFEVEIRQSAFKDRGEFLVEAFRRAGQVLDMAERGRTPSCAAAVAR